MTKQHESFIKSSFWRIYGILSSQIKIDFSYMFVSHIGSFHWEKWSLLYRPRTHFCTILKQIRVSACRCSKCRNNAPIVVIFKVKFHSKQNLFPKLCLRFLEFPTVGIKQQDSFPLTLGIWREWFISIWTSSFLNSDSIWSYLSFLWRRSIKSHWLPWMG